MHAGQNGNTEVLLRVALGLKYHRADSDSPGTSSDDLGISVVSEVAQYRGVALNVGWRLLWEAFQYYQNNYRIVNVSKILSI
jgi:diaminopimelate decarboxylase